MVSKTILKKSFRAMAAAAMVCGTGASIAAPTFTDWTSISGNGDKAFGTNAGVGVTVTGVSSSTFGSVVLDGTSPAFNDPSFSPTLVLSDFIELVNRNFIGQTETFTISFSQAVIDPVLHIGNLASTLTFNGVSPVKVSGESHFAVAGNVVSGSDPQGQSEGTLRFVGTYDSISFVSSFPGTDGFFVQVGFTAPIPEPSTLALYALGLAGIGAAAARRKRC